MQNQDEISRGEAPRLRAEVFGIPLCVRQGPMIMVRPEWPVAPEYNEHGFLVSLRNKDTLKTLPRFGPYEPIDLLLHRLAGEREVGVRSQVYFIGSESGPIKIGYSGSAAERLKALQAGSPVKLTILAVRQGGRDRESAYHYQFDEHRLHNEWFSPAPEILAVIDRLSGDAA